MAVKNNKPMDKLNKTMTNEEMMDRILNLINVYTNFAHEITNLFLTMEDGKDKDKLRKILDELPKKLLSK